MSHEHSPETIVTTISTLPPLMIITEELELKKITPADTDDLFRLVQNNPDIPQYTAWAKGIRADHDVIPNLQKYSNATMDGRYIITADDRVVGSIWAFAGSQDGEFGMGYCLDKSARGKGYVTKAATFVINQLKNLGAQEIYFQIIPNNLNSGAVAQRLGFMPAETVVGTDFPVEQKRWRLSLLEQK